MKILPIIAILLSMLVLVGCQTYPLDQFNTNESDENETSDADTVVKDKPVVDEAPSVTEVTTNDEESTTEETVPKVTGNTAAPTVSKKSGIPRKVVYEGDLVAFPNLRKLSVDDDGDPITVKYPEPLDKNGEWQTKKGDAAEYLLTFTISDGKTEKVQRLILEVKIDNRPPFIKEIAPIEVLEGETVELNPVITDPEDDSLVISYSGFMDSDSKITTTADVGAHTVTITAFDGVSEVSQDVAIKVMKRNRAPLIESISDITVVEGQTIQLDVVAADPDGDSLTTSFSAPVDTTGKWVTEEGDAGIYTVTVSVNDGKAITTETVKILVSPLNEPPVITGFFDATVSEGETVTFNPEATDPEGKEVTLTYSGWMTTNTYTTTNQDSGTHTVKLTASDGVKTAIKVVKVTVEDVNNAPEFPEGNWWD